jgi:hypothetical protein
MQEKFKDILEKDEKIVKVYKPNKLKFWVAYLLLFVFGISIWSFCICLGAVPEVGKPFDADLFWLLFRISLGVFVVLIFFEILFGAIYYKNKYYAYTEKRIIIRSGVIGVDYKSLEFKSLTATIVNVTFIDKILGQNTGSIIFGSPSSPMVDHMPYTFKHIAEPYLVMREIKEHIDAACGTK